MFALVAKFQPFFSRCLFSSLVVAGFLGVQSDANAKCFEGTASISVYGLDDGEEPDASDIKKAKAASMRAAWVSFSEKLEVPLLRAYMQNKDKILGELNFYVREKFSYEYDRGNEKIIGKNCISVNMERLKASLNIKDKPEPIASGEGSVFVTLFVARQAISERSFDAIRKENSSKTGDVAASSSSRSKSKLAAKEKAQASGGTAISIAKKKSRSKSEMEASATQSSSSKTEGSTEIKSAEIAYKIISADAANGALSEPLTNAGYEASDYEFVEGECNGPTMADISKTFSANEKLTSRQLRGAARAARKCDAKYFAVGSMTADVARMHQSGMKMVIVRVQGTIYNVSRRLPRRVATIPPKQYPGLAPNEASARNNALTLAGKEAGETITGIMRGKGLR